MGFRGLFHHRIRSNQKVYYQLPLSEDARNAYLSMPKDDDGFVKSLFYVPAGRLSRYEEAWREWLKGHPKHEWPVWIDLWARRKKQKPR